MHEITHLYQWKNKQIKKAIHVEDTGNVTRWFNFFVYFIQKHELEALMNESNKLYKNRGDTIAIDGETNHKKTFLKCLIYTIMGRSIIASDDDLRNQMIQNKISIKEMLEKTNSFFRFLVVWTVFCYGVTSSKYAKLLKKEIENEDLPKFNTTLINKNRRNLQDGLSHLDEEEKEKLSDKLNKLPEDEVNQLLSGLFSISDNNFDLLSSIYA